VTYMVTYVTSETKKTPAVKPKGRELIHGPTTLTHNGGRRYRPWPVWGALAQHSREVLR
jgi:hypothetical protein